MNPRGDAAQADERSILDVAAQFIAPFRTPCGVDERNKLRGYVQKSNTGSSVVKTVVTKQEKANDD